MKKEGNINFYNVFIEFYKFSVTDDNLYYYNGETEDRYPKGTIGEINGMNNVKVKLPDTIEEICDLLEFHKN